MRKGVLALLASGLLAAATAGTAAANHSWGSYHWSVTSIPFNLTVVDTTTGVWPGHVKTAVGDWTQARPFDLSLAGGSGDRRCKAISGKIKVCNNTYGFNGWLGLATISISGGTHITQATTKVNDSYFNSRPYTSTNRQHVMCQEIGHDFGLDHQDESGADLNTCMDYSNALDNPHPNAHDYEQLDTIYSHTHSTSTVSGAIAAGQAADENASPVATERVDRIATSVITEHFADGTTRVTHVLWALGGPGR